MRSRALAAAVKWPIDFDVSDIHHNRGARSLFEKTMA